MTVTNGNLVTQIRQALDAARETGQPSPGRPTLVRLTGATDHAVRKVLAELATENANAGEPGSQQPSEGGVWPVDARGAYADQQTDIGDLPTGFTSPGDRGDGVASDVDRPGSADDDASTPATAGGRFVAWAGFVFGSVMSIAANVLHVWLPAPHEPPGWVPGIAPQVGAAVWPVGLMLAVEALSRIPWPKGMLWGLARYGGAGAVAVGSAVISYGHLRGLMLAWQYDPVAAAVGPLVLDGLMVVCGFALLAMSRTSPGEAGGERR
ncbi:DUF2637 domain-containing protein [Amycolatopsis sp. lyj-84]|uniref:DUF2637 domain-containing protein n=1 Tax=Amycolatopsis sp. lyj-84 TaxID=2789284 RepID=UPI00397C15DD